jgi:hypothetical protein
MIVSKRGRAMPEKLIFDEIVLLILSIAFNYFGLSLSFAARQYKAFGASLNRPLARSPIWVIRGVGILLILVGKIPLLEPRRTSPRSRVNV